MLHACFTPIALCFVYTSWHFYAFFGTNLLTRCHSASSYFLLVSILDNYLRKYSQNWTKQGPNLLFFLTRQQSPKQSWRGAPRWPHHTVARAHPWPCSPMVWAPWASTDLALPPIYCPRRENPIALSHHPQKVPQRCRHRRQVKGDRNLCSGTLPRWGIAPGAISIDSTTIFIAIADSHDEEGVVLP
jgi:hypothetical protein